jgi:ADP-ribosylglycohydrolase
MYAGAFLPDAAIESVLSCGREFARDGTAAAIDAVLCAVDSDDELDAFITKTRKAFVPFDHKESHMPLEAGGRMADNNQPSSRLAIEEVPIALAALKWGQGDFLRTVKAAVSYGRDCDSTAAMACGLLGAIYGQSAIPISLREASNAANRRDWNATAVKFTETILEITKSDRLIFNRRLTATELSDSPL